jgi:hypothetical protein
MLSKLRNAFYPIIIFEKEISLELTARLSVLVFLMSHRVSRFWA